MLNLRIAFPDFSIHSFMVSKFETPKIIASVFQNLIPNRKSLAIIHKGFILYPHLSFSAQDVEDYDVLAIYYVKTNNDYALTKAKCDDIDFSTCVLTETESIRKHAEKKRNYLLSVESRKIADVDFLSYEMKLSANIIYQKYLNENDDISFQKNDEDSNKDEMMPLLDDGMGNLSCEPLPICFAKEDEEKIEREVDTLVICRPPFERIPQQELKSPS